MIDAVWRYIMEMRYERKTHPQRRQLANTPSELFEQRLHLGGRFKIYPSGNEVYQVEDLKGRRFVVDMEERTCGCGGHEEYQAACSHMLCVLKHQGRDIYNFMNYMYTTDTYRKTYAEPLYPLSIESLLSDPETATPAFHTQLGRPISCRMRREQ